MASQPRPPRVTGQAAVASQPRAPGPAALSHQHGGIATIQMAARWQVSPVSRALLLPPPPCPILVEAACGAKASTPVWSGCAAWPRTSWGGAVRGCSGGLEAGDDIMMGAGSAAREPLDDHVCIGGALESAGCSPRRMALDDRFELHSQEGPAAESGMAPAAAIGDEVKRGAAGVRAPAAWLCAHGRHATGPSTALANSAAAAPAAPGRAAGRAG
jgi:hypothetical protein